MEMKTDDQLVPIQTPLSEVKKRGRPKKSAKVVRNSIIGIITYCQCI